MTNAELLAKIKAEIDRRYEENREKARYNDYYCGMNDGLDHFEQFLDTLELEKPINPDDAMKELDEKIALVKERGTWDGVDVDKYMDEVRGGEPVKPIEGLEVASVELADMLLAKQKDYAISAKADYWNGAHDGVIAGAFWRALNGPIPLSPEHIYGSFTLEIEEPCEELEEEVKRYYSDNFEYLSSDQPTLSILTNIARHFTDWQKEQDTRDMFMSDNRHFNKVYELGKNDMKEQMMKEAVEWTVTTNLANRPVIYLDQLKGFQYGDKVRVIIVKE